MKYKLTILNILCFGMILFLVGLYLFGGKGPWDAFVYFFGGIVLLGLLIVDFCIQVLSGVKKEKNRLRQSK